MYTAQSIEKFFEKKTLKSSSHQCLNFEFLYKNCIFPPPQLHLQASKLYLCIELVARHSSFASFLLNDATMQSQPENENKSSTLFLTFSPILTFLLA